MEWRETCIGCGKKTECGVGGRPVRALSINEKLCVTAGDAGPAAAEDPYLDKALSFSSPHAKRTNDSSIMMLSPSRTIGK